MLCLQILFIYEKPAWYPCLQVCALVQKGYEPIQMAMAAPLSVKTVYLDIILAKRQFRDMTAQKIHLAVY